MKLSTHILALLMIFGFVSLIGCDNNKQATAQQCLAAGPRCVNGVVAAYMSMDPNARAAVLAQAQANGLNATTLNGVAAQLPPGAPQTLPLASSSAQKAAVQQQAQKVRAALKEASANPMSSYYEDPNAQDIPARSAISEKLATMAVNQESRQPASVQAPAPSSRADGDTVQ